MSEIPTPVEHVLDDALRDAPVVRGMMSVETENFGPDHIRKIISDPRKQMLIVAGPPGVGKSTYISEMAHILRRFNIAPEVIKFDNALEETRQERGLPMDKGAWSLDDWTHMSNKLYAWIDAPLGDNPELVSDIGRRQFRFVETVSVGEDISEDRAQSTLQRVITDIQSDPSKRLRTSIVFMPANPVIQSGAGELRELIGQTHDKNVVSKLQDKFHVTVRGLESIEDPETQGKVIKDFIEKMAAQSRIEKYKREIEGAVSTMIENGIITRGDVALLIENMPGNTRTALEGNIQLMDGFLRNILYMVKLRDAYNAPPGTIDIAVNQKLEHVTWYIDQPEQ